MRKLVERTKIWEAEFTEMYYLQVESCFCKFLSSFELVDCVMHEFVLSMMDIVNDIFEQLKIWTGKWKR